MTRPHVFIEVCVEGKLNARQLGTSLHVIVHHTTRSERSEEQEPAGTEADDLFHDPAGGWPADEGEVDGVRGTLVGN